MLHSKNDYIFFIEGNIALVTSTGLTQKSQKTAKSKEQKPSTSLKSVHKRFPGLAGLLSDLKTVGKLFENFTKDLDTKWAELDEALESNDLLLQV